MAKEKVVVVGRIYFMRGIQETWHLQHVILRQVEDDEVRGYSFCTMEDVIVAAEGVHWRCPRMCHNVDTVVCLHLMVQPSN